MRVLETKKPGLQISMGKRKHKLRKQREDSSGFCSESSDEGVTGLSKNFMNVSYFMSVIYSAARGCPHVSKAVNLNSVRKALRLNPVIGECTVCIL